MRPRSGARLLPRAQCSSRWTSAAVLEASERSRTIRGYRELERLIAALRRTAADEIH